MSVYFNDACVLLDPQLAEAHANLANALQQLGSLDLAIMYYQVSGWGGGRRPWLRGAAGGGGGKGWGRKGREKALGLGI